MPCGTHLHLLAGERAKGGGQRRGPIILQRHTVPGNIHAQLARYLVMECLAVHICSYSKAKGWRMWRKGEGPRIRLQHTVPVVNWPQNNAEGTTRTLCMRNTNRRNGTESWANYRCWTQSSRLGSVGISAQAARHNTAPCDPNLRPYQGPIIWSDKPATRKQSTCREVAFGSAT